MTTRRAGIEEPVLPALARVLRRAVLDHLHDERRRVFPTVLHVGFPGTEHRVLPIEQDWRLDQALRVDMIEAITRDTLAKKRVPLLWLTRPKPVHTTSDDLAWAAAARAAGAELGVNLDLVVVTRRSWRDPRTGVGRTWERVRERSSRP